MKKILLLVFFPVLLFAQSNHTVSFSGNSSDFNSAEKYSATNNVDYYATFDATYLYLGAFRIGGEYFNDYDHFTVYVDSDAEDPITNGTGSTTGVLWDSNTPTLPFTANYRVVIRKVSLGESFYSSYSGGWTTGSANGKGWTQYATNSALEVRVPWSDLGNPSRVYLKLFMSYNGGFFGQTSASYFGGFNVSSGVTPLSITETPLPVELTSFTAKLIDSKPSLTWQTATEINNYGFDVERSTDKSNWSKIGFVQGAGNSNSPKSYSYTDNTAVSGKYFYRLKQVDTDGTFDYSPVVEVDMGILPGGYRLEQNYPNPFNPSTSIKFAFSKDTKATIKVYNALGVEVREIYNGIAEAGRVYDIKFNAAGLSSGVYYYKLITPEKTDVRKMMLTK